MDENEPMSAAMSEDRYKVISLFSGAMALDI